MVKGSLILDLFRCEAVGPNFGLPVPLQIGADTVRANCVAKEDTMKTQAIRLEEIHETIVYLLECLLQRCYGDLKLEHSLLAKDVAAMTALHPGYRNVVVACLKDIEADVHGGNRDRAAHELIALRHRLRDTVCSLTGEKRWYPNVSIIDSGMP
jgi:hypothetical protein